LRRGRIDALGDLTAFDLSPFARGQGFGRSGYVERGFTSDAEFYRHLVADAGFDRGERILDLGCGFGRWSIFLAEVNRTVTGIDPMGGRLAIARNLAAHLDFDNTTFVAGSGNALPFAADDFDAAWCYSTLHFLDRRRALAELRRVLVPGGRLFVALYFAVGRMVALLCESYAKGGWDDADVALAIHALEAGAAGDGAPNMATAAELDAIMARHGFRIERRFDIDSGRATPLSDEERALFDDPPALVARFRADDGFRARLLADYPRLCRGHDYNLSFLARAI
jgi:SAM-dependent methyltransferase